MSVAITNVTNTPLLDVARVDVAWEARPDCLGCQIALFVCQSWPDEDSGYVYYCGEWDEDVIYGYHTAVYYHPDFYKCVTSDYSMGSNPSESSQWEKISLSESFEALLFGTNASIYFPIYVPLNALDRVIIYSHEGYYNSGESGDFSDARSISQYEGCYFVVTEAYYTNRLGGQNIGELEESWAWLIMNAGAYEAGYFDAAWDVHSTVISDGSSGGDMTRPTSWVWTQLYEDSETGAQVALCATAYIPGDENGIHPVTATEWNKFTTRINEFREYKGYSNYGFTYVYGQSNGFDIYGNATEFTLDIYNEAVEAIHDIGGNLLPISVGTELTASLFLDLANELNAIE